MFYHETAFLATFLLPSCYLLATFLLPCSVSLPISFEYPSNINGEITTHYPSNTLPIPFHYPCKKLYLLYVSFPKEGFTSRGLRLRCFASCIKKRDWLKIEPVSYDQYSETGISCIMHCLPMPCELPGRALCWNNPIRCHTS